LRHYPAVSCRGSSCDTRLPHIDLYQAAVGMRANIHTS
jgi:hypothetical protein